MSGNFQRLRTSTFFLPVSAERVHKLDLLTLQQSRLFHTESSLDATKLKLDPAVVSNLEVFDLVFHTKLMSHRLEQEVSVRPDLTLRKG